jgi:hypothetical protein
MPVNNSDVLRVSTRLSTQGQGDFVNVWHFAWTDPDPVSDEDAIDFVAARVDKMYDIIQPYISNDAAFVDINVFDVTQDRPLGSTPWPSQVAGGDSDETLPAQVSAFVRFPTGYSRNWAKKFIGPMTVGSNTTAGLMESTVLAALAAFAAECLTGTVGTDADKLVLMVYHNSAHMFRTCTSAIIRNVWATVRTRRAGRGA